MNHEFSLLVKLCEKLPYDLTLFAKDGRCQKFDHNCSYQIRKNNSDLIICRKKTTTTIPLTRNVI